MGHQWPTVTQRTKGWKGLQVEVGEGSAARHQCVYICEHLDYIIATNLFCLVAKKQSIKLIQIGKSFSGWKPYDAPKSGRSPQMTSAPASLSSLPTTYNTAPSQLLHCLFWKGVNCISGLINFVHAWLISSWNPRMLFFFCRSVCPYIRPRACQINTFHTYVQNTIKTLTHWNS